MCVMLFNLSHFLCINFIPRQNSKEMSAQPRARRGRRDGQPRNRTTRSPQSTSRPIASDTNKEEERASLDQPTSGDADLCFICAEPVKYFSVTECNHRTCHVCALRLRALWKRLDCTFCKVSAMLPFLSYASRVQKSQPCVIFTTSPEVSFSNFTPESIPYKDQKLSIYFETQEMQLETLILLRFNCPDPDCEYIGSGWDDLKLHVRGSHGKLLWSI